jgi:hypothetical protein
LSSAARRELHMLNSSTANLYEVFLLLTWTFPRLMALLWQREVVYREKVYFLAKVTCFNNFFIECIFAYGVSF